jgi:hypothetical protein
MEFATDIMSTPGKFIDGLRYDMYQGVSSSTNGYIGGGDGAGIYCTFNKLSFATETSALIPTTFPSTRYRFSATESSSYGYFAAGITPTLPGNRTCNIARLDFATDVLQNTLTLPVTVIDGAGIKSPSAGYFGGGSITPSTVLTSNIYKINFSTETTTLSPAKVTNTTRRQLGGFSNGI